MNPKSRLATQSDSIFGIARTLLVPDARLSGDAAPRGAHALLLVLTGVAPKFLPYQPEDGAIEMNGRWYFGGFRHSDPGSISPARRGWPLAARRPANNRTDP